MTLALKLNQHYSLDDLSFLWTTFPFTGSYSISTRYTQSLVYGSIRSWLVYGSIREWGGRGYKFPEGAGSYKYLRRDLSQFICSNHKRKGKMLQNMLCLVGLAVCLLALASTGKSSFCSKAHFFLIIRVYTSGAAFPRIKNLVESREVLLNSSVSINCSIEEGRLLHWLHNNVPNITATTPGYTMTGTLLTLTSFSLENSGEYRCAAYSQSSEGGETMVALSHITELSTFSKTPQLAAFSYTN